MEQWKVMKSNVIFNEFSYYNLVTCSNEIKIIDKCFVNLTMHARMYNKLKSICNIHSDLLQVE